MAQIDSDHRAMPPLQAVFDSAKDFGLTDDEIWRTINESLCGADPDATVPECLDELTGALARLILAKQRRRLADEPA